MEEQGRNHTDELGHDKLNHDEEDADDGANLCLMTMVLTMTMMVSLQTFFTLHSTAEVPVRQLGAHVPKGGARMRTLRLPVFAFFSLW